jgi:hypothetical protein
VPRRSFLAAVGGAAAATTVTGCVSTGAAKTKHVLPLPSAANGSGQTLSVQPVLVNRIYARKERTSWRPWGGLKTEGDVREEMEKINKELEQLGRAAEFPMKLLPLKLTGSPEESEALCKGDADVMLIYGAGGEAGEMEKLISPNRFNLVFLRHETGPAYLWYEIASPRLLRKTVDELGQPGLSPRDVVVDRYEDLLWRLRALYGLKNTMGSRIIAIGAASGWGAGGQDAPKLAVDRFHLDIRPIPYKDIAPRVKAARDDVALVKKAEADAERYIHEPGVTLRTDKGYLARAFVLAEVFKQLMAENEAPAMTINECMGTIMPLAETTACMPLSLINDSGLLAFCESDFVVIPSGILLRHICGTPVFLQDPTYPHAGVVTVAHCTAPRKMNGKDCEKTIVLTHFESDYGAAPKVEMRVGQDITMIDPDFAAKRWIGFGGKIVANPFLDICRSQVDVSIDGDCEKLAEVMCGFHWMMCYGDYRKEVGYALGKVGIDWLDLTSERDKMRA